MLLLSGFRKKYNNKIQRRATTLYSVAVSLIAGVTAFLYFAGTWLIDVFGNIPFSTVIYQITSPLKGTNADYIMDFIIYCVPKTILIMAVVFFMTHIVVNGHLQIEVKILKKNLKVPVIPINKVRYTCLMIIAAFIILLKVYISVGMGKYFTLILEYTTLYEQEYVDPLSVDLIFPEQKRNLILIYLESMETTFASKSEGGAMEYNYIPELTGLAEENFYFSHTGSLGGSLDIGAEWTMGALVASSLGVPYSLPIGRNEANPHDLFLPGITGLGDILEAEGYEQEFMCGSSISFAGRDKLYEEHGDYKICDYDVSVERNLIPKGYKVFWGFEDKYLFANAKDELLNLAKGSKPFNFTMLTVDTHFPDGYKCDLCDSEYGEQYYNVMRCSARQVDEFITWIKQQDFYDHTTIILMGDHKTMNTRLFSGFDSKRRVYNCFINLPFQTDRMNRWNRIFTTYDYFPTILGAMDVTIEGNRLGLGTNLFSEEKTLAERMGAETFKNELLKYSSYYYQYFIKAEKVEKVENVK